VSGFTYEPVFDDSNFDLVIRIGGELTLEALLESRRRLFEEPRLRPGMAVLFDYSEADARLLTVDDIRRAAGETQTMRLGLRAVAVVAADDLTFGLARMFGSFARSDDGDGEARTVVRTVGEAEDWLRSLDAGT
jgi:hypothetical protein